MGYVIQNTKFDLIRSHRCKLSHMFESYQKANLWRIRIFHRLRVQVKYILIMQHFLVVYHEISHASLSRYTNKDNLFTSTKLKM